jgi:hypothetical protein
MSDYAGNKMEFGDGGGSPASLANVQGTAAAPSELDRLKKEKERATLEKEIMAARADAAESGKKIADTNKAALAGQFPVGTSKPLEGTIATDDKFGYLAELLAYGAFSKKIEEIAKKIKGNKKLTPIPPDIKILMVDSMDAIAGSVDYLQIKNQLDYFLIAIQTESDKTDKFLPKARSLEDVVETIRDAESSAAFKGRLITTALAEVTGLAAAGLTGASLAALLGPLSAAATVLPGIFSTAADVAGYFQSNYDVNGRAVSPQNVALQAMLAGRLAEDGFPVYFPNLHFIASSKIVDKLKECLEKRIELVQVNAALKPKTAVTAAARKKLEEEIAALEAENKKLTSPNDDKKIGDLKKQIEGKKAELAAITATPEEQQAARNEALLAAFDAFHLAIVTVPTGKAYSPLLAAAMQEYFTEIKITHLLYLSVASAGGEAILEKRHFRASRVSYTGGGAVTCIMADTTGQVVYSASEVTYAARAYPLGKPEEFNI